MPRGKARRRAPVPYEDHRSGPLFHSTRGRVVAPEPEPSVRHATPRARRVERECPRLEGRYPGRGRLGGTVTAGLSSSRRSLGALLLAAVGSFTQSTLAIEPILTKDGFGLSGYDAVAYFTESKAVPGSPQYEYQWAGVRWRFASAAHLAAFAASPEKYAPQYGGYCAYAVSRNQTAPTDPGAWKVVDGKLYLNYDQSVRALWEKELPDAIQRADRNWPAVLEKPAR